MFFDKLNILRTFTFYRALNFFNLLLSYFFAKNFKLFFTKKILPFSVSIEPSTACNLACPECPSGLKKFSRKTGRLNSEFFEIYLQEIKRTVCYINFYFQGEPFLNPDILYFISQAKKQNIYTSTSTNAHFIDTKKAEQIVASGLDRLIVSIDGITQEVYEGYRKKGRLSVALSGLENMVSAKKKLNSKTPWLIFQFLVLKSNEHQIEQAKYLSKKYQVDEMRFKTAQFYDFKNGNILMPDNLKYARYKKQKDGTYQIKNKLLNHCWRMWTSCVITWDGKVVPCCFDKDATHRLGDLKEQTLKAVWKNDKYQEFRKTIFQNRSKIDICNNCTEGSKVWN